MVNQIKSTLDLKQELKNKESDNSAIQMGCTINNYEVYRNYFKVLKLLTIALALLALILGVLIGGI